MKTQIIAYRIEEKLFCRECYEKSAKDLPEGLGDELPGKALTIDDIGPFFCGVCKTVKGLPPEEIGGQVKDSTEKNQDKDLSELRDMIEDSADKIESPTDAFCQVPPGKNFQFSDDGRSCFYHIFTEITNDLDSEDDFTEITDDLDSEDD